MKRHFYGCLLVTVAIAFACLSCSERQSSTSTHDQTPTSLIQHASIALKQGDLNAARGFVNQALLIQPDQAVAYELAGDIESTGGNHSAAVERYQQAVQATSSASRHLLDKLGRTQMAAGYPYEAVLTLQQAVARFPADVQLRIDLIGLLLALGSEPEAGPHLRWLIMQGHGTLDMLSVVSDLTRSQTDESICRFALEHAPGDLRPQYALARKQAFQREWGDVATALEPVIEQHPEFCIAQAYYLRAIVELEDHLRVNLWYSAAPKQMDLQSQYWKSTGILAERQGQLNLAAQAYWRACRLDPNDVESHNQLAFVLARQGRKEEAALAIERAADLARVRELVDSIKSNPNDSLPTIVSLAKTLQRLGRRWEAAAWLRGAAGMSRVPVPEVLSTYIEIHKTLSANTPWQLPESDVALRLRSSFPSRWSAVEQEPEFDWSTLADGGLKSEQAQAHDSIAATISFADVANQRGLNHVCEIRKPEDSRHGVWIYQVSAGGAAVLDFDLDGWPDIHLSMVDGEPLKSNSSSNRLFRNQQGHFHDVTNASQLGDTGFTQGFSVGDVNADGFDDVFVANIGTNRLYLNRGDGTFNEVGFAWGLRDQEWTSSAALADIDLDGLTDLFEVNYCAGPKPYQQACEQDGIANPCLPTIFPAMSDSIRQGLSDGGFLDRSKKWLPNNEPGRGFGVVVGFLDEQQGMDVYVANDMSANHFWSTESHRPEGFQLIDQSRLRGLAFNRRSLPQASMGVAVGDPDNDGDVDFYVTHFAGDYNTFYEQILPGIWSDVSEQTGHATATTPMLGFGTQFLDADNDGQLELLIANGHVFNQGEKGPYRMPSQLMQRKPDGTWVNIQPSEHTDVLFQERISRSLITWDFNRDGRMDALMTHLFDPVTLLQNKSITSAKSVTIYLKGTRSSTDAIGAQLELNVNGRQLRTQLFGGHGFQCSNQRCLLIGLGLAEVVDSLTVRWPHGEIEGFGKLNANHEYLLVEGEGKSFCLSE